MGIESNEVLERLPKHLLDLVIDQPYNDYTFQDQAVWRYVMRQNVNFLGKVAHESYLEGLKKTGISIDEIPHMYGMNRILSDIGWAAVSVDGFIPPQAFMEFQAYNVLVIAADIRNIGHIEYTPAPDIIHEAAGHAPIIADKEYADYLKLFGEVGAKAFSSAADFEMYEAIRYLSIIKEDPSTSQEDIDKAEREIERLQANVTVNSEMARIRNLHWWTVEYGLIGTLEDYKIYGAGLLSSIGESASCMNDEKVKKRVYSVEAADYSFDITTAQPQLFITPSFEELNKILLEFSEQLAWKRGGLYGLKVAIESNNTGTAQYNSGIQVSGTFSEVIEKDGEAIYIKTNTPTQLCLNNKQLEGHAKEYHAHGFSSPVGKLKGERNGIEFFEENKLSHYNIVVAKECVLNYESGVQVSGVVESILRNPKGQIILISFSNARVTYGEAVFFEPEWGMYDMTVGSEIESVYSGCADAQAYGVRFDPPKEKTHKIVHNEKSKELHQLYGRVRLIREGKESEDELVDIFESITTEFSSDWLLALEILEIVKSKGIHPNLQQEIESYLGTLMNTQPSLKKLISDGLNLIKNDFELIH